MNEESKIWDCIEYLEAEGFLIRPVKGHRTDVGDEMFLLVTNIRVIEMIPVSQRHHY